MMHIYSSDLKYLAVSLPPLTEQTAIARFLATACRRMSARRATVEREIELLREYRTRLIADVVTGKLDVREAAAGLPNARPVGTGTEAMRSEANSHGTEHVIGKEAVP